MKGRGVRTINPTDLRQVTRDAAAKDKFILIDAVGVTESAKSASQALERKRTVGFEALIDRVAAGERDDDALSSLAGRLAALAGKLEPVDRTKVREIAGRDLQEASRSLLDAIDPDVIEAEAVRQGQNSEAGRKAIGLKLKEQAGFTLKERPLKRSDLDDFVSVARLAARHDRKATERFRPFSYDELIKRDKLNLDIVWLKDASLEDPDSLPPPDEIAAEIVENLEAALERFRSVAARLG